MLTHSCTIIHMAKTRKNIMLPDELAQWLKETSETTGIPMSRIIEDALKLYRKQPEVDLLSKYRWERK
jgi:predicted DNA-binding protein